MLKLVFIFLATPLTAAFLCHNNHSVTPAAHSVYVKALRQQTRGESVEYLFDLCQSDSRCRKAYYMNPDGGNTDNARRAFEYLVRHWTASGGESMASIAEEFCEISRPETLWDTLWLAKLRLEAHESNNIRCGANERFVFVPATMQGECMCVDEHNCQENGNLSEETVTLSTVALVMASSLVVVYLLLRIRNDQELFLVFRKIRKDCDEKCGHRAELVDKIKT